jgi:hypothetical protein
MNAEGLDIGRRVEAARPHSVNSARGFAAHRLYFKTAGERFCSAPFGFRAARIAPGSPSPSVSLARGIAGAIMEKREKPVLLRSIEDLADAKELRSVISMELARSPIDESALRCAVWSFVGTERRAGVPPALVITRLTGLIDDAAIVPMSSHLSLTRHVILWCVEEYFGCLGGNMLGGAELDDDMPAREALSGSAAVSGR